MVRRVLKASRDRKVLRAPKVLLVRLVLQGQKEKLDCRVRQGRKEFRDFLDLLAPKVSKDQPAEQPRTCALLTPLVRRSHARRTKRSSLQFAKVEAADRLCRMALFDVLARAELLDSVSGSNAGLARPG